MQKSGSWYAYGKESIGQGREATKEWLREHDKEREEIKRQIRKELGMVPEEGEEVSSNGVAAS